VTGARFETIRIRDDPGLADGTASSFASAGSPVNKDASRHRCCPRGPSGPGTAYAAAQVAKNV